MSENTENAVENFDEEDVPQILDRETQDGAGFESEDELSESNFEGYAEPNVEVEKS